MKSVFNLLPNDLLDNLSNYMSIPHLQKMGKSISRYKTDSEFWRIWAINNIQPKLSSEVIDEIDSIEDTNKWYHVAVTKSIPIGNIIYKSGVNIKNTFLSTFVPIYFSYDSKISSPVQITNKIFFIKNGNLQQINRSRPYTSQIVHTYGLKEPLIKCWTTGANILYVLSQSGKIYQMQHPVNQGRNQMRHLKYLDNLSVIDMASVPLNIEVVVDTKGGAYLLRNHIVDHRLTDELIKSVNIYTDARIGFTIVHILLLSFTGKIIKITRSGTTEDTTIISIPNRNITHVSGEYSPHRKRYLAVAPVKNRPSGEVFEFSSDDEHTMITKLSNVIKTSTEYSRTAIMTDSSELYTMGAAGSGELGIGRKGSSQYLKTPQLTKGIFGPVLDVSRSGRLVLSQVSPPSVAIKNQLDRYDRPELDMISEWVGLDEYEYYSDPSLRLALSIHPKIKEFESGGLDSIRSEVPTLDLDLKKQLESMTVKDLKNKARFLEIKRFTTMRKKELITNILKHTD